MTSLITKKTQTAAKKTAIRTAGQTFEAGLDLLTAGGAILGATNVLDVNWVALAGGLGFVLLNAGLAGLRSYVSIASNGLPAQYATVAE